MSEVRAGLWKCRFPRVVFGMYKWENAKELDFGTIVQKEKHCFIKVSFLSTSFFSISTASLETSRTKLLQLYFFLSTSFRKYKKSIFFSFFILPSQHSTKNRENNEIYRKRPTVTIISENISQSNIK